MKTIYAAAIARAKAAEEEQQPETPENPDPQEQPVEEPQLGE